jgi:hypothetical protein
VLRGSDRENFPAAGSALRAEVDEPIGRLDHVEVVLDDDDGVALVDETVQNEQELAHVFEVQSRCRLVENIDASTHRSLLQLGRELDALRLSPGQGRRALAEPHVAEADVDEGVEEPADRGDGLEELGRLADRHVEHLGDVLSLVVHSEGLPVVASPVADLADHVHVGKKVHLDLDGSVTRAVLAPPALDVEAESAGEVAPSLGVECLGEQGADLVEDAGVGRRIGARGAADRGLVDVNHLVEVVETGDPRVLSWYLPCAVELVGEHLVQDVVDETGLA